jgi:DnaJ like chaperone protein
VIRKRYRELVAKYHPDKFIGQNLDKEFVELASRKFQRIQEAYERIRRERNMH